ncbi:MAG: hypothetical protein IKV97_00290 [Clostridia bacterium]|nr:hypothetical protein [Clostridia bacterium]
MKKLIFALIATIALLCAVSPFAVAEDIRDTEHVYTSEVTLSRSDLFSVKMARFPEEKVSLMYDDAVYRLYEILRQGLTDSLASISLEPYYNEGFAGLSYYNESDMKVLRDAFSLVIDKSPELFYVHASYSFSYSFSGKITSVSPKYTMSGTELTAAKRKFENHVESVVSLIPEDFTDYEKILFVNDYLCTNFEYDSNLKIFDAYNFFEKGTGVCEAYNLAFTAIMDKLGIKCDSVASEQMNHVWNYVQLNGNWYHIDVTWNDPVPDAYGRARHRYFLMSDDGISQSHYGYTKEYECNDTTYDTCELRSIDSAFAYIGDKWYAPRYDEESCSSYLYEFESPELATLSFDKSVFDLGRWMTGEYSYFTGSYCYLSEYKDTVIFNTQDTIYIFDGENISEFYRPQLQNGNKIYGFTVKGDALMCLLNETPNGLGNAEKESIPLCRVIFENHDGSVLRETFATENGDVPEMLVPQAPQKPSDVAYEYEFSEWKKITRENTLVFIPEYTATIRKYSHKFVDFDGTVIKEQIADYGAQITAPQAPERQNTVQYSYSFDGWENFTEGMTQSGEELVFTARYSEVINKYTYKFLDFDGRVLKEETVDYGTAIVPPHDPERPGNDRVSYIFKAWENFTPGMTQTGEELVFTATYHVITDAPMGDVTGDGTLNRQDLLRLAKYFAGWNVSIDIHTSDVTGDGAINRQDLLRLAKYFAGWNVSLG